MEKFLEPTVKQFRYYKLLGEKAMAQLNDAEIFEQPDPESNSIAIIVKHMHGNMLSRWTDFLTTDGEKPWRNRDREFFSEEITKEEVLKLWEEGWAKLFNALGSVNSANIDQVIYIRNEGHSVMEAIIRQLAHYCYHVGQIVFFAKQLKGENWNTLSIPKNNSAKYNEMKFQKDKRIINYTDEEIKRLS